MDFLVKYLLERSNSLRAGRRGSIWKRRYGNRRKGRYKTKERRAVSYTHLIWKYNIGEDESCHSAAVDLVDQGCNVIISDSYGHQSYMTLAASENPDVQFLIATGDTAAVDPYDNTHNFFTHRCV